MKNTENSEIISKNRRKYYLKIHLILVVKYRKKLINDILKKFIYNEFNNIAKKYNFTIDEINDDKNHIHLLISYDPNIKISSIVMRLKQISTYNLWLNYEDYLKKYFLKKEHFGVTDISFLALVILMKIKSKNILNYNKIFVNNKNY